MPAQAGIQFNILLLPGVQPKSPHPFGGVNTRIHMTRRTK
jgi:hypothetical protein